MVKGVSDPLPERRFCKEGVALPELVKLRVSIKHTSRDELVKDTNDQRRQYREKNVVKGPCPRFVDNLSRIVVEERILQKERSAAETGDLLRAWPYPKLCHVQDNVLVKGNCDETK